jgi:hypothetical protein
LNAQDSVETVPTTVPEAFGEGVEALCSANGRETRLHRRNANAVNVMVHRRVELTAIASDGFFMTPRQTPHTESWSFNHSLQGWIQGLRAVMGR